MATSEFIRLVKIVSGFSILAGVLFGLAMGFRFGVWEGIRAGILFAVLWGPLLIPVLSLIDAVARRKLPPESARLHQQRELSLLGEPDPVFQACHHLLSALPFFKSVTAEPLQRVIEATTRSSWASSGEKVTVRIEPGLPGTSKVTIESRPRIRTTVADCGKNWRNVEAIVKALQEGVQRATPDLR